MSITDRTRKILWGRSGNRCAMCRRELVLEGAADCSESVVGDECHIISGQGGGPRFLEGYPSDKVDELDNLILLCRVHHKLVDDQHETYSIDVLQAMKANHAKWVTSALSETELPPLRLRKGKTPSHLGRISDGSTLLAIVIGSYAYDFTNDEIATEDEVELVGGFLQDLRDWGEIGDDLEPSQRVRAGFDLGARIRELEAGGFYVFGGQETRYLEGGTIQGASTWPMAIVRVLRSTNTNIIKIDLSAAKPDGS